MAHLLSRLRTAAQGGLAQLRVTYLRKVWGMTLGEGVLISGKAFLDFTNPKGIHIGSYSIVTPGVRIFTHDFVNNRHIDTHIGSCCFIGANALILGGVKIGDHCVVAAGSVLTKDVPAASLVAGNPAKIIRSGITTGHWGMMAANSPGLVNAPDPVSGSRG